MSSHEIRFRRKMITSRKIGRHKDYNDVLRKHEKRGMYKKILKIVVFVIFLLVFLYMVSSVVHLTRKSGNKNQPVKSESIE